MIGFCYNLAMKPFQFKITKEVIDLGIVGQMARIIKIRNFKTNNDFETYLQEELKKIKDYWADKNYKEDFVFVGFKELHEKIGRSNRKFPASPAALLSRFLETGKFPRINMLVDIYNLISLKTRLALGAHNIDNIQGNITLRLTKGDEKFLPLGSKELVPVPSNEYSYIDDGNNIICRMEVLQVEPTKTTLDSTDIFLIVQGNKNTTKEYVMSGASEVISIITKYCGGEYSYLNDPTF